MIETIENRHWDLSLLPHDPLVFDLGALHGIFANTMADRGCRVVCFEPDPLAFTTVPKRDGVIGVQKAVGFPAGIRKFFKFLPGSGANGLYMNEIEEQKNPHTLVDVEVITLQDAVNAYGTPSILKMNIEGAETEIILHSSDELLQSIPQMTISFHAFCGFISPEVEGQCKGRLRDLGFDLITFHSDVLPEDCWAVRKQ